MSWFWLSLPVLFFFAYVLDRIARALDAIRLILLRWETDRSFMSD